MAPEEKRKREARSKDLMAELAPMSAYIEGLKVKHGNPPVGISGEERRLLEQYRAKMLPLLEELAQLSGELMRDQGKKEMS